MSVDELIVLAKALPREDQLRLVEAVQEDRYTRTEREFAKMLEGVKEIPFHTPYECYAAASALQKFLEEGKTTQ